MKSISQTVTPRHILLLENSTNWPSSRRPTQHKITEMSASTQQTDPENSKESKPMSERFFEKLSGLDEDQKVFELASLFLKIADIAYFIGKQPEELAKIIKLHPADPLSIAYHRGQLKTMIMLRYDARRYAVSGSPEANKEMLQHLSEQIYSENA